MVTRLSEPKGSLRLHLTLSSARFWPKASLPRLDLAVGRLPPHLPVSSRPHAAGEQEVGALVAKE